MLHADFLNWERKLLYICLERCDGVIAKRARNMGQHQIRKEEISNLEVIGLPPDSGFLPLWSDNPDPELHSWSWFGWNLTGNLQTKNRGQNRPWQVQRPLLTLPFSQYNTYLQTTSQNIFLNVNKCFLCENLLCCYLSLYTVQESNGYFFLFTSNTFWKHSKEL